ncbi:hypothetical protein FHS85_001679 [Rhodoligotrophos appendicifer]|uniref:hypothetical protein n=1 Tax=Rhodoligotrophos appendicifer TaxID=987056 RepID=UPI001186168D|nr:hypothetical protein [Rhodoligotrophos appendicifer]
MNVTVYSFLFAFLFLWIGLFEFAAVNRLVYPRLRWRYEKAKMTQQQGIDPNMLLGLAKVVGFILLPVLGFYLGSRA